MDFVNLTRIPKPKVKRYDVQGSQMPMPEVMGGPSRPKDVMSVKGQPFTKSEQSNIDLGKSLHGPTTKQPSVGNQFKDTAADFLFGKSDWEDAAAKAAKGNVVGALGSAAWGGLSLGSTLISFIPGLGTAAGAGIKGAVAAAKAGKAIGAAEKAVAGGKAVEKAVQGGKALKKDVAFSPGYPFGPTAPTRAVPKTKPLGPTTPQKPMQTAPKREITATPDLPDAMPKAKNAKSPWAAVATNVGTSALTSAAISYSMNPKTAPSTQPAPEPKSPNNTPVITDTNTRKPDDNTIKSNVGMQFAEMPRIY